jgi:adenylate cyclase
VSVLFADISGSTLMYAVRGDEVAFKLTSACLSLLEQEVQRFGGRVIKRVGDAILAAFAGSEAAVRAAAGMQHALESPDCPVRGEGVLVRVGVSTGMAVRDPTGDVYGDIVNIAARLVSLAGADEIFLNGEAYEEIPAEMRDSVRLIDQIALRGRPDWVLVYQYLWKQEGATVSAGERHRGFAAAIELTFGTDTFALGPDRPRLTIGRDASNDVTIDEEVVSRRHCEVVLRGDKYFVVDRSTNGTYVCTDAGDTFRLCRDEMTLAGSGRIHIGKQTMEPLRYRIRPR